MTYKRTQGWTQPGYRYKSHYIIKGISLCRRTIKVVGDLRPEIPELKRVCKSCFKRYRRIKAWQATTLTA